jgi:hypothetical protein
LLFELATDSTGATCNIVRERAAPDRQLQETRPRKRHGVRKQKEQGRNAATSKYQRVVFMA